MYMEKNTNGNIVVYQSQRMNVCWGFIDRNNDYIGERSAKKGQIFHFFKNAIAIQEELLTYLEKRKCRNIKIRVKDYEDEDFWAIFPIKDFRNKAIEEFKDKAIFCYDKKNFSPYGTQVRLPLHRFVRKYDGQKTL